MSEHSINPSLGALSTAQERITVEIRRLHAQARPLNIASVRDHSPKLLDRVYAIKPFLGWKRALVAAGLSYDTIRIQFHDKLVCRECGAKRLSLMNHFI